MSNNKTLKKGKSNMKNSLNKIYRLEWSTIQSAWVPVAESAKARGKGGSRAMAALLLTAGLSFAGGALADTWVGGDANWAIGTNWLDGSAPTSSDFVDITNGGTANISNSGTASSSFASIGGMFGSGVVTVDGTGSTWTSSAYLSIGSMGSGALNITNGGTVSNTYASIGTGIVTVDGTGSTWTNSSFLSLGSMGNGTLNITNGGAVSNTYASIGTGIVTVDGLGSTWTNSDYLSLGVMGNGTLNITNGGTVSNTYASIGTGVVTVDGLGSTWTNSDYLSLGGMGNATLNIRNGGAVNVNSGVGTVTIGSSSTLNIGAAQGSAAVAAGTLNAGTVSFGAGTGALVFNHTDTDYVFTPSTINGAGSIGLYAGTTRFALGSLSSCTCTMTVDGGTLDIADGSTLFLGGQYTQTANGTLQISASSASSYGNLNVTGQATFAAGTGLNVNVAQTNTLANGNALNYVVRAGNLTASTFNVTDNSALFNFTATVTEGANGHIDLSTVAAGGNGGGNDPTTPAITVLSSVRNTGFTAGEGAARVLDVFVQGGTTDTNFDNIVTALGQLGTEREISNAVAQTLPLMSASMTEANMASLYSINRIVQARQSSNKGLSSGDDFLGDRHIWFKPFGSWASQDNHNGAAGYDARSFGGILGFDGELSDQNNIGLAFAYSRTDVDSNSSVAAQSADINSYRAIVYGSHSFDDRTELSYQADVGYHDNEGNRTINFGGLNSIANSNYSSWSGHIGAGLSRSYAMGPSTTITPVIRADYSRIHDQAYSETGAGALNLNVNSNSTDELVLLVEGRLSHAITERATLLANLGIGYDALSDKNSITATYTGGGTAFSTQGIDPSATLVRGGLGFVISNSKALELTARYDFEARSRFDNQTASLKIRVPF